ncbi:hypothetical protein D9Q98_005315 [Chlorella vulgaris]|uniref:GAF domain-containing protein n=1 Tax=Chlorella vulgaris TaxID=3077 RepID=A0A9D4TQ82_CHLVU|nr:hypothetical protein D9Q98_005315 [Chlorella vulgaris]
MVEAQPLPPLPGGASKTERAAQYDAVLERLRVLLQGESDWVAAMSTVVCELHVHFDYFHWTGFYRAGPDDSSMLVVGPYQGALACQRIPFSKGVCGAAASTHQSQLVPDVHAFPGHIACASSTQSEVVVPVVAPDGSLLAVLDVDSDLPAAFTATDVAWLEELCGRLGAQPWATGL